jgi:HEPN domain-containing protein
MVNLINMKSFDIVRFSNLVNLWFVLAHENFNLRNDAVLNEGDKTRISESLNKAREELNYVGLEQSAKYVSTVQRHLSSNEIKTYEEYVVQVDAIHDMSINEIEGIVFGFLPRDHGKYFNQNALFGSEVNDKFKNAVYDIKEAGNCYAHGTYTACVFHLMRVLEIALHKLATDLGVTFPATLELENWQNIIEKIESEITAREKRLPKGTAKSEEMQHYSEAAKEFRYFKNAWRNHVSHSRVDYEIHDATKIMEHVRDFMQHLASR